MADDSETNISEAQGPGNPSMDQEHKIARYVEEIELYDKEVNKWDRQSKRIISRYKDDRKGDGEVENQERRYNILYSNTENLEPALYARNPKPDIQRRFKDADPIGRVTSDILERSVTYFCDTDLFAGVSRQCVKDYLLPGRGTAWVRYVPHFKEAPAEITDDKGPGDDQSSQAEAPLVIDYEEVVVDYVHREDFGHNIARTWEEVWLIWRKVYLSRKELIERFARKEDGGKGGGKLTLEQIHAIPLDYKKEDDRGKVIDDGIGKAVIYEVWDKTRRVALWFHKFIPDCLDLRPDPLRLENFFPTPKPLLSILANDSLIPVPLYVEYQDQAAELDLLTARISYMTRCLKVVGVHDASVEGLNRMFNEGTENELIPIQSWALFAEKGGMDGTMQLLDIKSIAACLLSCYEAREKVKRDLDEITGMSDIIRGATDPNETATAQRLKSGYAGQRISDMQQEVQRFIRELVRLMTDVIANHFQIETIKQISGVRLLTNQEKAMYSQAMSPMVGHNGGPPLPPSQPGVVSPPPSAPPQAPPPLPPGVSPDQFQQMMEDPSWDDVEQLIRNQALRCFRIDIETDSTIRADEEQEKQSRVEFLKAAGGFLQQAVAAGAQSPEMVPLLTQMLMFGVRAFPVGKELEGAFNSTMQKLEKAAANPQPRPDPEMAKVQAQAQSDQMQAQMDAKLQMQKMQMEWQMEQMKTQAQAQSDQAKAQAQAAVQQHLNVLEDQRRAHEIQMEAQMRTMEANFEAKLELMKAHIQAAASIEVARINAKADDGAEAEAREVSGEMQ